MAENHARPSPRGDATLERLLDGAVEVFAKRGYHAANVREICARSGVGIGTFYAHFGHKRELLRRVFLDRAVPFSRLVTPADLLDHDLLVACLRAAVDHPVQTGCFARGTRPSWRSLTSRGSTPSGAR